MLAREVLVHRLLEVEREERIWMRIWERREGVRGEEQRSWRRLVRVMTLDWMVAKERAERREEIRWGVRRWGLLRWREWVMDHWM